MVEIVGVRFKRVSKIYYFDPKGLTLAEGTRVIVETSRGVEIGTVVLANRMVDEKDCYLPLSPVLRVATPEDLAKDAKNREKEKSALKICEEKIAKHKLGMTLVDVEYTFDNSKIIFSFVAEGRVDFRELVKDLASVFRTRIELCQIGARDETKALGALGTCGRVCCCKRFLSEFVPVSVRMAKDQGMSTNPTKITGACGKLICCLSYEENVYEDAFKTMPRVGYTVSTPDGVGVACEVSVLNETVKVRFDKDNVEIKVYPAKDVKILRGGKQQRQEDDAEELSAEQIKELEEE